MMTILSPLGWLACVFYSTIPAFWLLIHPLAKFWRWRRTSPYRVLLPLGIALWIAFAAITFHWRNLQLYKNNLAWIPAVALLGAGVVLYKLASPNSADSPNCSPAAGIILSPPPASAPASAIPSTSPISAKCLPGASAPASPSVTP